jgi:CRP-like cAMP-binding protein
MEALPPETARSGPSWISRLVEVLQPLSVRADRLGAIELFAGLPWTDLEFAAACLGESLIERGTRMTVQGQPSSRLWLITQGEALVSADARPLRVAGRGDLVGGATLLFQLKSPETTFALTPIRAFEAGPQQFRELIRHRGIRERLASSLRPAHSRAISSARRRSRRPSWRAV